MSTAVDTGRGSGGTGDGSGSAAARHRRRRTTLWGALVGSVVLLASMCMVSLAIGSGGLPLATVWQALTDPQDGIDHSTIRDVRVPRTALGIVVGAALGAAGALAQGVTRNPLADPGILGVNAGAGLAIALGVAAFGITNVNSYIWFSFAGALGTTVLVYAIASRGPLGPTPLRLTMVGVALGAVFQGISRSLSLLRPETFDQMRYWGAGTLADRPGGTLTVVTPFITVGLLVGLLCARSLNALAMGEDLARTMGVSLTAVRTIGVLAITLLCGAATAAAGPISFIGLMVPHAVRFVTGPDQRWVLALSMVLAPVLLLAADIIGRLIVMPSELQAGVLTAFLGAPVLVYLVRRSERRSL